MTMKKDTIILAVHALIAGILPLNAAAQETLTLRQCRDSAIANNQSLKTARQQILIAGYDRKIAFANYFPNVSATAGYVYNGRNLNLEPQWLSDGINGLASDIRENPLAQIIGNISGTDIGGLAEAIGEEINKAFELDIENMFVGAVSLQQPVFMGGKIINSNKMASLAEDLAESQYLIRERSVTNETDHVYWQTVSIAQKEKLAKEYSSLLHDMLHDTELMVEEGICTQADLLSVKVRANEADMMLTKASNGLALSKMLLCKLCGMDIYKEISLADEDTDTLPMPQFMPAKSEQEIYSSRPEIKSLETAGKIFDRKAAIAKSDMMPRIALTANYLVSNPNLYNGFRNEFAGTFNVGIAINIPIIHGCEAMQKVRKAKAEAIIAGYRTEDAKRMVSLQVAQLRRQQEEALEKLEMAISNMESAEENLRIANAGYNEGMIPANVALAAHAAWMEAHSEYIDTQIELQLCTSDLLNAEGTLRL